jgi:hypothetical protein
MTKSASWLWSAPTTAGATVARAGATITVAGYTVAGAVAEVVVSLEFEVFVASASPTATLPWKLRQQRKQRQFSLDVSQ